jgi:peptidoglycan/LPS O-acetylase OafA/YrhL
VAVGLVAIALRHELFGQAPRWLASGIPAFVVVVCAVALERLHGVRIANRWAILVGDASYVMYLIHAYVVFGVLRLVLGQPRFAGRELAGQLVALGLMAVSAAAAVAIYRWYEQPILRALKRRFIAHEPAAMPAAAPAASAR